MIIPIIRPPFLLFALSCHLTTIFLLLMPPTMTVGNENAKRLYDDLLINYNKLSRPCVNPHDKVTIHLRLRLSQIIDVHEKDQIMTTSVWLKQEWMDHKLRWEPATYGGVSVLYVPAEMLWVPDIVLYNNADNNYNITIATKATLHHTGKVTWEPPAIFKSMCQIDVQWFPFDDQECILMFGSWTFSDELLDLLHLHDDVEYDEQWNDKEQRHENVTIVREGIDLSEYYPSVEWDILAIPSIRSEKQYFSCCPDFGNFIDITYTIKLRRKPLFYTVNLIFPCVGISFLTILVFYLPSDSGEKITLCISILVSLTVFFLLLTEIIPATSVVLPLIGKYLLFTMIMVSLSVIVTVIALNLHFRTPTTHRMPSWVKTIFLHTLPKYLFMRRPLGDDESFRRVSTRKTHTFPLTHYEIEKIQETPVGPRQIRAHLLQPPGSHYGQHERIEKLYYSPPVLKAFKNICFIAELLKRKDKEDKIDEDWKYVAMVLDRLFLWIFSGACFLGTIMILLQAPTFYDSSTPIKIQARG